MSRSTNTGGAVLLTVLLVVIISALLYGWLFMLFMGAMHAAWAVVPAIGYGASFWPGVILGLMFGSSSSVRHAR